MHQIDRQIDRQTDRQMDRSIVSHTSSFPFYFGPHKKLITANTKNTFERGCSSKYAGNKITSVILPPVSQFSIGNP